MYTATNNVLGMVYKTSPCNSGMNEAVKVDAKISRKVILLLAGVIENAMGSSNGHTGTAIWKN